MYCWPQHIFTVLCQAVLIILCLPLLVLCAFIQGYWHCMKAQLFTQPVHNIQCVLGLFFCVIQICTLLLGCIAVLHNVDEAYWYRPSNVVCWSVALVSRAKTAEAIEMPFELRTQVDPGNHEFDRGSDPRGKGQFWGVKEASHCKV